MLGTAIANLGDMISVTFHPKNFNHGDIAYFPPLKMTDRNKTRENGMVSTHSDVQRGSANWKTS